MTKPTPEHVFWAQGQASSHFNEVSLLPWASNLISCLAVFYWICSALWFKLKVYSHTFFFKYTHMIFETLIETDFVLLFPYTFVFCLPASGNIHHTVSQYWHWIAWGTQLLDVTSWAVLIVGGSSRVSSECYFAPPSTENLHLTCIASLLLPGRSSGLSGIVLMSVWRLDLYFVRCMQW